MVSRQKAQEANNIGVCAHQIMYSKPGSVEALAQHQTPFMIRLINVVILMHIFQPLNLKGSCR